MIAQISSLSELRSFSAHFLYEKSRLSTTFHFVLSKTCQVNQDTENEEADDDCKRCITVLPFAENPDNKECQDQSDEARSQLVEYIVQ